MSSKPVWRCLEVEWDSDDVEGGLFGTVNPWDVVVAKK